jgi:hypothetical protein
LWSKALSTGQQRQHRNLTCGHGFFAKPETEEKRREREGKGREERKEQKRKEKKGRKGRKTKEGGKAAGQASCIPLGATAAAPTRSADGFHRASLAAA